MSIITNAHRADKRFHILARGVIIDGDYILVARAKNAANTFLPGGHQEFHENLKQTLKREIKEETGMDCTVNEYLGCTECQWIENNIINQEINHIFIVNDIYKQMEIASQENHLVFYWIRIEDMEKENLLPVSVRTMVKSVYENNRISYMSEII